MMPDMAKARCICLHFRLSVWIEVVNAHRVGKCILEFVKDACVSPIRKLSDVSGSIGVANLRTFFWLLFPPRSMLVMPIENVGIKRG